MSAPQPSELGDLSKSLTPISGFVPTLQQQVTELEQPTKFWTSNPLFTFASNVTQNIKEHRKSLDLINPGAIENINKEVARDVFLNQLSFSGLKADLSKTFAYKPVFQVAQSFAVGGQASPYTFTTIYANDKTLIQASIDNDYSISARINQSWDSHNVSKLTLQLSNQTMCQLEQDYQANDFSLNFKALNPDFSGSSFKGVLVGSILQSITSKLALGIESVYSSMNPGDMAGDSAISLYGRYNAGSWIASGQLQGQGALVASLWRKVADKFDVGIETTIQAGAPKDMMNPQPTIEGITTIGAKYEFRQDIIRGQIDSTGKVACLLEHRLLPTAGFLVSAELDQFKNTAKIGLGIQIDVAGSEEVYLMQNGMIDADGNPVPGASQVA